MAPRPDLSLDPGRRAFLGAALGGAALAAAVPRAKAGGFTLEEATVAALQAALASGRLKEPALAAQYLARIRALDGAGPALRSVLEVNPEAGALATLWEAWLAAHPEGGEIPLEAWSTELACSREATARALGKLAQGRCTLTRKLEASPRSTTPAG